MRWLHFVLGLLVVQVSANAAPLPSDGRPPATASRPQQQREEAQVYSQQLDYVLNEVEQNYVRPVPRVELVHAALSGLFEAARLPVRSTLRAEVEAADKQKKLAELVVRVRLEAGDHEAIRGPSAVHASVRAMMRALDPFSGLLTADELRRDKQLGDGIGRGDRAARNRRGGGLSSSARWRLEGRLKRRGCVRETRSPTSTARHRSWVCC